VAAAALEVKKKGGGWMDGSLIGVVGSINVFGNVFGNVFSENIFPTTFPNTSNTSKHIFQTHFQTHRTYAKEGFSSSQIGNNFLIMT
jgi:hypothetical protein